MAIDSTMMICLHCYAGGHDKFYNIWIEKRQAKYYLMFAYGRATQGYRPRRHFQGDL